MSEDKIGSEVALRAGAIGGAPLAVADSRPARARKGFKAATEGSTRYGLRLYSSGARAIFSRPQEGILFRYQIVGLLWGFLSPPASISIAGKPIKSS